MEKVGNYLPWEQGYYEHNGSYKKSNGDLIFCYTYYFSGKTEQIETKFPINVRERNKELLEKYR